MACSHFSEPMVYLTNTSSRLWSIPAGFRFTTIALSFQKQCIQPTIQQQLQLRPSNNFRACQPQPQFQLRNFFSFCVSSSSKQQSLAVDELIEQQAAQEHPLPWAPRYQSKC
eukprot:gene10215-2372_t